MNSGPTNKPHTLPVGSLLSVRGLRVTQFDGTETRSLLKGVDLDLDPGQALALVGPSGCGKSLTARALLGLLPPEFAWQGEITWRGVPLSNPAGAKWQDVRGAGLGLILQEPMSSLNPVLRVGDQIAETIQVQRGVPRQPAQAQAVEMLAEMQVPEPSRVARLYPHQLSGGMRQRVLLAAALACDPDLLIADEPTTALDVSVQREILALINRVRSERGMALIFITHDLNLVPLLADRVAFMSEGRIQNVAAIADMTLPDAPPLLSGVQAERPPVLTATNLTVKYDSAEQPAVAGIDLELRPGCAVGLLGESGCGKTSLGRALAQHVALTGGQVLLNGQDGATLHGAAAHSHRRRIQMLFQDPGSSLNPRQTVAAALKEAAEPAEADIAGLLTEVGLGSDLGPRYPHQLSGGQRQRVALARCLATSPTVLIADEPTSALDTEARELILSLLRRIMQQRGLALLFISHDLEVMRSICDEVHVMYGGLIVETLPGGDLFLPRHPYTQELLLALPRALREDLSHWQGVSFLPVDEGGDRGTGCPRFGKCPLQKPSCGKELPPLKMQSKIHWLRCPEAEANGPAHFIDTL